MLLPRFDFHDPASVGEALDLKKTYGENARILAGGTDLLVLLKKKLLTTDHVISVSRIEALYRISEEDGAIAIGACATMAQLAQSELVREKLPALRAGAQSLGNHLIRNKATVGGNVCNASPAGDSLPALLVYKALVVLESGEEKREVPIEEFFTGPGKTGIRDDEILTCFKIPIPGPDSGAAYLQLGKRKSSEINVVNVASFLRIDPAAQTVLDARIALGSVAPTPIRAPQAEGVLKGADISEQLLYDAAEAARSQDCAPIDDFRGTAAYRRAMIGVLTRRTLDGALQQAQGT